MVNHHTKSGHNHQELIIIEIVQSKCPCHLSSMHWKQELLLSYSWCIRGHQHWQQWTSAFSINLWFSKSVRTCPIKRYYGRTYWEGRLNPLYLLSLWSDSVTSWTKVLLMECAHMYIHTYIIIIVTDWAKTSIAWTFNYAH